MDALPELIGNSPAVLTVKEKVGRLLQRQSDRTRLPSILILGETGSGKGLLARGLHRISSRAQGPFVDVNCAAIPDTLLESEMFGFERGAFTDARQAKAGLFQTGHRGTIFLDEIGLLPLALQAKLLKAIEERAVRRLGGTRNESVDVWVLAATSEDLLTATQTARFREDLYHRLAVVTLTLPPLRDRGEDVLLLAELFLARACADYGLPTKALAPAARAALLAYRWPGNIRELINVMERVALLSEGALATLEMLGLPGTPAAEPEAPGRGEPTALEDAVSSVERAHLLEALRQTAWNITRAAARLGISRDTLRYRITKHGLRSDRAPAAARRRVARPTAPAPEAPSPATMRWERRRLTLLRVALLSPSATDPRLYPSRLVELFAEKVETFGGRVEERSPTGLVAAFGLEPVEDAPRRAAHAAMAIQKAVERAGGEGPPTVAKSAVHVGHSLVGQGGGRAEIDLDGKREAWTVLEGLLQAADPDSVVVSEAAATFLERHFRLTPAGAGEAPIGRVFRLAAGGHAGLVPGRRMVTFVGRRHELELLQSRLAAVVRGHGQAVGIVGEAGIGKSRLLFEFRRSLRGERVAYLEGRCQSYGGAIPYLPILDILRQNFRLTEAERPEAITTKVRLLLANLGMSPDEWGPYLLQLFGIREGTDPLAMLSPEAIKSRTLEALRQMGLEGSRRRPTIFAVEDLHWIDRTSEECFASLLDSLAGAPVLFVATYRPGYRPAWLDRSNATQIALQPLSPPESLSVVRAVLPKDELAGPLAERILQKAEGNPFFLEELSRAVGEEGDRRSIEAVPDTIQEVLLARINRLPDTPRRLLQTASVLGRVVSLRLLGAVWEEPQSLDAHLRELTRLEFLYAQGGEPEPGYAFTHALTQEVTYASLVGERRQAIHAAAGEALESLYGGRLAEAYDRLAYHYSKAERADKALDYLTRLAEKAARGHAHTEAVRALEEALTHVERRPVEERDRQQLDLVLRQVLSLIPLGQFAEIQRRLRDEHDRLVRLGDPFLAGRYHFLLGHTLSFLGDQEQATVSMRQALREAEGCGDGATLGKAYCALSFEGFWSSKPREGIEHGRRAVQLLEPLEERWWLGQAHATMGINHAQLGEFAEALAAQARAGAIADAIADPRLQSFAAWTTGMVYAAMGDSDAGIEACRRGVERAPDPLNSAIAQGWLGYAYLEKEDPGRAIPLLDQAIHQLGQFRFGQLQGFLTIFLAEAHRVHGQLETARALAAQGLAIVREAKFPYARGWAERALGRIAQASGDLEGAESRFEQALRAFSAVHARYDLARTSLDLATLAHARGNADAVRRYLEEAARLFAELGVPRHLERTRALAETLGRSVGP
jgi:DNA-binding NtrC family response regulator/tetratricopeptide (TPR) repeat protein